MTKAEKEQKRIREKLKHNPFRWEPVRWLDTGSPELNRVIGHRERGIPYGRIIEISGLQSHGKTVMALQLAAAAQDDKARVIWVDLENTWDDGWAEAHGVAPDEVLLLRPYLGTFGNSDEPRMITGQEQCAEAEEAVRGLPTVKESRALMVLDSVAAITTVMEVEAGPTGQNTRTRMELPMFLSGLLKVWVGLAQVHNVTVCLINQLRQAPMAFGDPYYTPGGRALDFYSHVRVRLRRKKRLKQATQEVGLEGVMTAEKNKVGGYQGASIQYRIRTDKPSVEFL